MIRSTGKTKFAYLAAFIALSLCAYCRDAAEIRGAPLPRAIPHGAARCGDSASKAAGKVTAAEQVVRDIRDRYDGVKRNPFGEAECGHHYARALDAWSVLQAW